MNIGAERANIKLSLPRISCFSGRGYILTL